MTSDCPLCQEKNLVLTETPNYKILAEKYPIIENTILITTKKHIRCHALGLESHINEFIQVKHKVAQFLQQLNLNYLIFFEHGIAGQTIPHAHLHCIPSPTPLSQLTVIQNPKYQDIKINQLPAFFNKYQSYYLLEENGVLRAYFPHTKVPGYFRKLLATTINNESLADWKNFQHIDLTKSVKHLQLSWKSFYPPFHLE